MTVKVCCAIIMQENKILLAQRNRNKSHELKWEFPGGKLEAGETEEECIIREIQEELSVQINILRKLPSVYHKYPTFNIELIPFICKITNGEILLKEHLSIKWEEPKDLLKLDLAEADIKLLNYFIEKDK